MQYNRLMLSTILATKLYTPPSRPNVVPRPRMIERLNEGLLHAQGVTLVSAPVGYGKTTLVSEWVASVDRPIAWLSLDEGDSDLTRFLIYLVAAFRSVAPNLAEEVWGALQSPPAPTTEPLLTALLNEIALLPDPIILVLDDYHLIDSTVVDEALAFIIEHLPRQLHLVITTREDPQLPLARLRAQGRLTELRAADLRFTRAEAAEFLNQVMSLNLSAEDIASLEHRTEGWIAGLQLAALSMRDREDIHGFIRSFAGDDRYIVDYLVEEVLQRQPEPVRNFLLQTSILDRLNGPLCDAVVGNQPITSSSAQLAALQRGNFFLIPLDNRRHWYRYHHLFAEVLYLHLISEQPDQVSALHRRASEWFAQNDSPADAIRHALAARDFERAADLIEQVYPGMSRNRQEVILLGWLKALPEALIRERPELCNLYAGVLLQTGEVQGVETWLLAAERWLQSSDEGREWPKVAGDREGFRRLRGSVAVHRAGFSLLIGDVAKTMEHAQRVLDLAPEDDFLSRGGAATLLGLVNWYNGDLEGARRFYDKGMAWLRQAGNISDDIGCAIALADIYITLGRLHEAMSTYEWGLLLAAEQGGPVHTVRGTVDMYVGMSMLESEHNKLAAAAQRLLRCQELGEHIGLPQNRYRLRVAMARVRVAEGNLDAAVDLLDEAEHLYAGDFSPNVRPIPAMRARVWLMQGRLGEALDWAEKRGLSADDPLHYLREFEHITLARILLAKYQSDRADRSLVEAVGLLERLLEEALAGGRLGSAIEILVLLALARQAQGDHPAALRLLQQALTPAEPEGYVRLFLDEGPVMAQLLREGNARGILPGYTGKLLEAFESERQPVLTAQGRVDEPHRRRADSARQPLIEPLSQREIEILHLFKTELSGPEIADQLVIALSTVRTHTKSIYSKLSVNNRRAAVKRAEELGLV